MIDAETLVDYLRGKRTPVACTVELLPHDFVRVTCGECRVVFPSSGKLTRTTINEIEARLERCLGDNWML